MNDQAFLDSIHWLGHDAFRIDWRKKIFIDPYQLAGKDAADLVFVTHEHFDHCSPEDIAKIQGSGTIIIGPADALAKVKGTTRPVKPGDTFDIEGIHVEVVPSYNIGKKFHPQANAWVGYVLTLEGKSVYHAGDTDRIPEMKNIRADVALLPVSGTYVMTPEEAGQAALDIRPRLAAIPMHYGSVVGGLSDAERFRDLLQGKVPVVIKGKV